MRRTSYRYHFTSPFYLLLACTEASLSDTDNQLALNHGAHSTRALGANAVKFYKKLTLEIFKAAIDETTVYFGDEKYR